MKRLLTVALTLFILSLGVGAQTTSDIPEYRQKGYAGSVSFTDQFIVWLGIDTSHGYMFNEHHYLGGGVGFFLAPIDEVPPTLAHAFVEYKSFWFKKASTPTAGIRAGFGFPITHVGGAWDFITATLIEPYLGWDWGLKNGKGLSLSLGADIFIQDGYTELMPKISFGFNF